MKMFDKLAKKLIKSQKIFLKIVWKTDINRLTFGSILIWIILTILFVIPLSAREFSLASIIAVIGIFIIRELNNSVRYRRNQEDIMRLLLYDIDFLIKFPSISSFRYENQQTKEIDSYTWPSMIQELNLNYYLTNISSEINYVSTYILKRDLKIINETIRAINEMRENISHKSKYKFLIKSHEETLIKFLNGIKRTIIKDFNIEK